MQTTTLTAPVRLSTLQSGMIFESVTIQLFILSLLLLSTAKRKKAVVHIQLFKKRSTIRGPLYTSTYHYRLCSSDTINTRDASDHTHTPSLCCALRLSSLGARGPSTFLQRHSRTNFPMKSWMKTSDFSIINKSVTSELEPSQTHPEQRPTFYLFFFCYYILWLVDEEYPHAPLGLY